MWEREICIQSDGEPPVEIAAVGTSARETAADESENADEDSDLHVEHGTCGRMCRLLAAETAEYGSASFERLIL